MERKIEYFTVREVAESCLRGFSALNPDYKYKVIFYNNTDVMENAKMFVGVWFRDKFYELKITMKRDRVEFDDKFEVVGDKGILYENFFQFVNQAYSIISMRKSNNKLWINQDMHDYEVSFILKRGVS